MNFDTLFYETKGPAALITLNRPDKLNAINGPMVHELGQALDRAESDDQVRAIIVNGAGRAFSAGFDLGGAGDSIPLRQELYDDFEVIMRFWESPKPTIAAVHTYCLGSAMELAVACDITISAEGCRFGAPEVQFGSGIVALILPWLIGPKLSKEFLLTGDDKIDAQRAYDVGLINKVVAEDRLLDEALSYAQRLATNDQLAVALTKQAINRSTDIMGMRQALLQALELDVIVETTETPESKAFGDILQTKGPKAAIAWRKKQFESI